MTPEPSGAADSIEIAQVARSVRRGWRSVVAGVALGLVAAIATTLWAPRIYQGRSSVLVRASTDAGQSLLSRIGAVGDLIGSGSGLGLGKSALETEIQVLGSRALGQRLVDSLQLQAKVLAPAGVAAARLIHASDLSGAFAPREYRFQRETNGRYSISADGFAGELVPGQSGKIPEGSITLAVSDLPVSFELMLFDREDAVDRLARRLEIGKAGGEVVKVAFKANDAQTAQAVPNALVAMYLDRRRTVDRGTNTKRVEFLAEQLGATGTELANAERALRRQQEKSGVLDAVVAGRVGIEQIAELRKVLVEVQVEEGAIRQLLTNHAQGTVSSRSLAAYPAFLKGASLSSLIGQLTDLESKRSMLLERRTAQDPEVAALSQSIASIEGQFIPMAQTYAASLTKQRVDMSSQLDSMRAALLSVPAAAETGGHLQRDVIRLSQIYAALQAQLVAARLAAIDEGGDVRQLDTAIAPRKPWFPRPLITFGAGIGLGLLGGLMAALGLSWFGRWMRDPSEMERVTGVPVQRLGVGAPLLVGAGVAAQRTLLVIPVEDRARTAGSMVAAQLVRTAVSRAIEATVLDLSREGAHANGNGAAPVGVGGVTAAIADLELKYGLVVVQLPGLASDATAAVLREGRPVLLVAPPDRVNRGRLIAAVETLRRLNIPCAGIVVGEPGVSVRT